MKKYILLLFCLCAFRVSAQKAELTTDTRGKFIYYRVSPDSIAAPSNALARAQASIAADRNGFSASSLSGDTALYAGGKLVVNKSLTGITHPDGEVTFSLTIEVKGKKFRYWLTDFFYQPYVRDRYGNFVPARIVPVALEKYAATTKRRREELLTAVALQSERLGRRLTAAILSSSVKTTTDTRTW